MDEMTLRADSAAVHIQIRPRLHYALLLVPPSLALLAYLLQVSLPLVIPLVALLAAMEPLRRLCKREEWIFDARGVRRIRHYVFSPWPLQRALPLEVVREAAVLERQYRTEVKRMLRVSGKGRWMNSHGRLSLADQVRINLALDRQLRVLGYFQRGAGAQA